MLCFFFTDIFFSALPYLFGILRIKSIFILSNSYCCYLMQTKDLKIILNLNASVFDLYICINLVGPLVFLMMDNYEYNGVISKEISLKHYVIFLITLQSFFHLVGVTNSKKDKKLKYFELRNFFNSDL